MIGRFRQYGIWDRYADLYPEKDLIFTVGVSDYTKDRFFAHVTRFICDLNHLVLIISFPIFNFNMIPLFNRKKDGNTYQGTTWQIKFKLDKVNKKGSYKLRIAIASATFSELQVLIT